MSTAPRSLILLVLLACNRESAGPPAVAADGGPAGAGADLGVDVGADRVPDLAPPPQSDRCAAVGCSYLPDCPGTCQAPCGCCPCGPGYQTCNAKDGRAAIQSCGPSGGCWEYKLCPDDSPCIVYEHGKAACVTSTADCPRIEAAYLREVQRFANLIAQPGGGAPTFNAASGCQSDDSCAVAAGHCSMGLGACWYVGALEPKVLGDLASLWQRLGCGGAVSCDCPALPTRAHCPQRNGPCVVQ